MKQASLAGGMALVGALLTCMSALAADAATRTRPPRPPYVVPEGAPKGPYQNFKPDTPAVDAVVQRAKQTAGNDFAFLWDRYCNPEDRWGVNRARGVREPNSDGGLDFADMPPTKMFDNFYYVGMTEVAAYALVTKEGIIVIDSLNNQKEAEEKIVGGLRKYGLDPKNIKYVIVMHGHGDHFGGARYLQETFGAQVVASEIDWPAMEKAGDRALKRNIAVKNGDTVTLGGETVKLYIAPGHTPGTLHASFTVYDQGRPHNVVFWGGSSYPGDVGGMTSYAQSAWRLKGVSDALNADVVIGNHPQIEGTTWLLRQYIADPAPPNPFIIGHDNVNKFIETFAYCATAARMRLMKE